MTAQGNPKVLFRRAVERGNVLLAETTAREVGRLTLEESPSPLAAVYAAAGETAPVDPEPAA